MCIRDRGEVEQAPDSRVRGREYVEFQCNERTFDLRGVRPTLAPAYPRIWSLLNLALWVEADTNRRCFLFVDSAVISTGPSRRGAARRKRAGR